MAHRFTLIVAGALATASSVGRAGDVNPLEAERWRTRPLVVVVPSADHPLLAQVESGLRDTSTRAGFEEREMVLFKVVAGQGSRDGQALSKGQTAKLLDAVGAAEGGPATMFLVGKDGDVKVSERRRVSLDDLFATIDRMPMRRR